MTNRRIHRLAGAAAVMALFGATGAFAEGTIKIGALMIDSGPLAGLKESQTKAINLAIDEINAPGGAAGKKFEPVFIPMQGRPTLRSTGPRARSRRTARSSSPAWTHRLCRRRFLRNSPPSMR